MMLTFRTSRGRYSPPLHGVGAGVAGRGYAEQVKDLLLQGGGLGFEDLDEFAVAVKLMAREVGEDVQNELGSS